MDVRVATWALSPWKRLFDALLAGAGLLLSVPLWLAISAAILLEDGWPVLYVQERVGRGGRVFRLYKFRSMVRDAERHTGAVLAGANDPRVTRVGRVLRATAMDELPQLVNIFLGHMSFVGPRPERPELVAAIGASCPGFDLRHLVRPGLTGPAQIYGHYESPPEEKLAHDLAYLQGATFSGDLQIIARSFLITFTAQWQARSGHVPSPERGGPHRARRAAGSSHGRVPAGVTGAGEVDGSRKCNTATSGGRRLARGVSDGGGNQVGGGV